MKTRRHLIAWLGLVLPTLAIGVLSIGLLAREQARLNAFAAQSVRSQVRTVADNIDLTMAEIKSGTMQALQIASGPGEEEARLQELAATNPFISHYLIWPPQPLSAARSRELSQPVVSGSAQPAALALETAATGAEPAAEQPTLAEEPATLAAKTVTTPQLLLQQQLQAFLQPNVPPPWLQQPPRRQHHAMQRSSLVKSAAENAAPPAASTAATAVTNEQTAESATASRGFTESVSRIRSAMTDLAETTTDAEDGYLRARSNRQSIRNISQQNIDALNSLRAQEIEQSYLYRNNSSRTRSVTDAHQGELQAESFLSAPQLAQSIAAGAQRREGISGWIERRDGTPGWLGWYQRVPGGRVTAVILNSEAVLEQLKAALPAGEDLRLSLLTPHGQSFHAASLYRPALLPTSEPAPRVGIGFELPGWSLIIESTPRVGSIGFFMLGGLLVAILCAATLGAGTLLLLQARRDAREASRKTTFVSNVSHELRTPLTTIRMYAEMLAEDRINDPERRKRYFNTITAESQRLSRLVDNVLDFGRLEQGGKKYRSEPVDIGALVQSVLDSQSPRLRQAAMDVSWQPPAQSVIISTDPDALGQVLLNLTDNALKYAASGHYLGISLLTGKAAPAGVAELLVEDRGPGIAPADRQRAFKAFQRLDESLTNAIQGSGLGLSICRAIIEGLGGRIALESAEAGGCRFRITLPAGSAVTQPQANQLS